MEGRMVRNEEGYWKHQKSVLQRAKASMGKNDGLKGTIRRTFNFHGNVK